MTAEQQSSAAPDDQRLIEAFEPVMLGILPGQGESAHAETLLALCMADGVLEVLEWAREGTGADPAASMWLAALRWYRVVTGGFPEGAPQPQPRATDFALRQILGAGALELVVGSAEEAVAGLASGEMHLLPGRGRDQAAVPQQPDGGPGGGADPGQSAETSHETSSTAIRSPGISGAETGPTETNPVETSGPAINSAPPPPSEPLGTVYPALRRVLPIGLAPYVERGMKQDWAARAMYLTHQDHELVTEARRLAVEMHHRPELPTEMKTSHVNSRSNSYNVGKNASQADTAGGTADASQADTAGGSPPRHELLSVVVEDLARRWRDATR